MTLFQVVEAHIPSYIFDQVSSSSQVNVKQFSETFNLQYIHLRI